ncbi:MAG: LysM peptidoglycan-binding domain-containing protein [Bacteroidales bacterium]|nr:LysM peptidoglycan-binding domain-containing protein [Bacteroidales bacterium]
MDIKQFIHLFKRHIFLLIAIPFLLAILVLLLTRNLPKVYSSNTKIYTGIATGYSIESTDRRTLDYFSTNIQFDNLINLIHSRQTIEKTAIRLLAQGLCLEQPNPQYISKENYYALHKITPIEVKDLVVRNGKMGLDRKKEAQINKWQEEIKDLELEINRKKSKALNNQITGNNSYQPINKGDSGISSETNDNIYHTVSHGESIYSIASRYNISIEQIVQWNNLENNSVISGQVLLVKKDNKVDLNNQYHIVKPGETIFSISSRYGININTLRKLNNIIGNSVKVGERLIISTKRESKNFSSKSSYNTKDVSGEYLSSKPKENQLISTTSQTNTINQFTDIHKFTDYEKDPIVPPGINKNDFDQTVKNLTLYYKLNDNNFVYELLNFYHKNYSISSILSKLSVLRMNNSDFIRVSFQSDEPGICQQTLKILATVFIKNYKLLRINQTDAVVNYFQEQVDSANNKLQKAEDRLLKFNQKNNIINYYEQSKAVAGQKEDLDLFYQNEQIRIASSLAAIREIETKLASSDSIYLSSDEISKKRKKLANIQEQILINQMTTDFDPYTDGIIKQLKLQAQGLKDQIKLYVDKLYLYSHSPQGIPIKIILNEWFNNAISYEEAKASLSVLRRRKQDFLRVYQIMAPLGAMLKRIEREIKVAEQSYLELLHSLNLAKMKQQNLQMSSNIRIIDDPYFPISANASKSKFLIAVAGLIGFVIVAFIILVLEYFDTTIKSTERVKNLTKLKLASAFPIFEPNSQSNNYNIISNRLIEILIQNIKLRIAHESIYSSEKPYLILIFSTRDQVGKTTIATKLINKLHSLGENSLYLNYTKDAETQVDSGNEDTINYKIDNNFVSISHIKELLESKYLRSENSKYDYIILEIPSIIYNSYPLDLMNTIDISLLVVKAKDQWQKADISALDTMQKISKDKPLVLLNQAEIYALEDIINKISIKKKKSFMKNFMKVVLYPFRLKFKVRVD